DPAARVDFDRRPVQSARAVRARASAGDRRRTFEHSSIRIDGALDGAPNAPGAPARYASGDALAARTRAPWRGRGSVSDGGRAAIGERAGWPDCRRGCRAGTRHRLGDDTRYARWSNHRATRVTAGVSRLDRSPHTATGPSDI